MFALLLGALAAQPRAAAEDAPAPRRILEEITVTAQRREQAEIDVPISMSVLDDDFVHQQGITDLRDVSLFVPNAKIRTSAVLPDIRIRGFGSSPVNPNFEQSVGLVLDGVPYTKKAYYQSALFDVGRIEVLRGPQGTLFGKNTTAGLLNVVSKEPTDEFTGNLDVQLGEENYRHVEAAIGGPLVAGLVNFRIAGLLDERDGYVENTTARVAPAADEALFARNRDALRFKLQVPDLLGSTLKLTYERVDIDLVGGSEFRIVPERTRNFFRRFDPNFDFTPDNYVASLDHHDGIGGDVDTVVANWSLPLGEWRLDAVGGFSILRDRLENDTDNSPAPLAFVLSARDNLQYTFEILGSSPSLAGLLGLERAFGFGLGSSNLVLGFFFQRRQLKNFFESLWLNSLLLAEFVALQDSGVSAPPIPIRGEIVPGPPEQSTQFFDETNDAFAGFGQLDWSFFPRWTLSYGMRLNYEKKSGHTQRVFDTPTHVAFDQVLNWHAFDRDIDRTEFDFAPKVALNYKPTDDLSLFASWARAFKGGGFNAFASGGTDDELLYEGESVTQWAIDAKSRLLDGAAELNLSLFRMDLENFQVLTVDPDDARITIENAARARAQGVEAEGVWLAADWLTVRAALGFNDSEFLEFPIATCPQDMVNTDGDADERCDVSGEPLDGAPKWTTALTTLAALPLTAVPRLAELSGASLGGLGLLGGFTVEYQDTHFLNPDFDRRKRQQSFFRFRGSVGFGSLDQRWSVSVTAENLTNEAVSVLAAETPTGAGHLWQFPDAPRLVYGQVRYRF
ncbi:MAG: TonB-dependent receptor [Candidatus Binatia bacterium]